MSTAGREMAYLVRRAHILGSVMLLLASLSGCKQNPQPEIPQTDSVHENKPQTVSPEKQAYLDAIRIYNEFVEHPKGHVYNVYPKERRLELCYLSAQVVAAAVRVPEFAADRNSDGEIKEWRHWIDIRSLELHC
jgi:hypothetical protein